MTGGPIASRNLIGVALARSARRASSGPPLLIDILPSANLLALWDAGNGSGGGSYITAADGQPVDAWTAAVGGIAPSNTTTYRPTYRQSVAAFNGRGAVEFNAAAQTALKATKAGGFVANLNIYSLYVVFATTGANNSDMYGEFRQANSTTLVIARYDNTGLRALHRSDANVAADNRAGTGYNDGAAHLLTSVRTASNAFEMFGDGVSLDTTTAAPGLCTIHSIVLGRFGHDDPGVNHFTGQISAIALYSTANEATVNPLLLSAFNI